MKYFFDCEFLDDGSTLDLISIGIVREDGREFYGQNMDCHFWRANDWVKQNVFPHLTNFDQEKLQPVINEVVEGGYGDWYNRGSLVQKLCYSRLPGKNLSVFDLDQPVELWGYYAAYDHVALCQLFGAMKDLPKGMPMYTQDIKQLCNALGNPKLPEQGKGEHHALADARWNKQAYDFLQVYKSFRVDLHGSTAFQNLHTAVMAQIRLRGLSNQELVEAFLSKHTCDCALVHELCRRVFGEGGCQASECANVE